MIGRDLSIRQFEYALPWDGTKRLTVSFPNTIWALWGKGLKVKMISYMYLKPVLYAHMLLYTYIFGTACKGHIVTHVSSNVAYKQLLKTLPEKLDRLSLTLPTTRQYTDAHNRIISCRRTLAPPWCSRPVAKRFVLGTKVKRRRFVRRKPPGQWHDMQ